MSDFRKANKDKEFWYWPVDLKPRDGCAYCAHCGRFPTMPRLAHSYRGVVERVH